MEELLHWTGVRFAIGMTVTFADPELAGYRGEIAALSCAGLGRVAWREPRTATRTVHLTDLQPLLSYIPLGVGHASIRWSATGDPASGVPQSSSAVSSSMV